MKKRLEKFIFMFLLDTQTWRGMADIKLIRLQQSRPPPHAGVLCKHELYPSVVEYKDRGEEQTSCETTLTVQGKGLWTCACVLVCVFGADIYRHISV